MEQLIDSGNALDVIKITNAEKLYEPISYVANEYLSNNAGKILSRKNSLNKLTLPEVIRLIQMKFHEHVEEQIVLERVIEYVNANSENKEVKKKREEMNTLLNLINIEKLGVAGIKLATKSKLFKKQKILNALLSSGNIALQFTNTSH